MRNFHRFLGAVVALTSDEDVTAGNEGVETGACDIAAADGALGAAGSGGS
jgi:hypothetical protein